MTETQIEKIQAEINATEAAEAREAEAKSKLTAEERLYASISGCTCVEYLESRDGETLEQKRLREANDLAHDLEGGDTE